MLKIKMDCPNRDEELELARRMLGPESPEATLASGVVQTVLQEQDLRDMRESLEAITVREELVNYMVEIIRTTRTHESVLVGAGPRATQALLLSSRAQAAILGRDFVTPDDVRAMVHPVLTHRLILRPEYEIEGVSVEEEIDRVVQGVEVPR
jgi:MoxR-like ATPase